MAFLGGIGKTLGLGSTKQVAKFGAEATISYNTGGAYRPTTSPFAEEQQESQVMMQQPQPGDAAFKFLQEQKMQNQQNGFFQNLGQGIGSFGSNVGSFLNDISPLTNLFTGGAGGGSFNQGPAKTIRLKGPEETSTSGEFMGANLGLGGAVLSGGRALARSKLGQNIFSGLAGGALASMGDSCGSGPRITRKMKADVRKIYMMSGMNPDATAQILNNLGTYPRMQFDANVVFFILTKRFRNDGPVVTKAAVRKTRSTLRRMKGVVDMYNSVCKPTTRRAPMRRATKPALQLIKN